MADRRRRERRRAPGLRRRAGAWLAARRLLALLALAGGLPPGLAAAADPPSAPLAWIHAEANEGGASGGHTALLVRDRVYHFQTVDGRTILSRWTWERFRRLYNDLKNRTLHVVEQRVDGSAADSIRLAFDLYYRTQRRSLGLEEDLAFQRSLAAAWAPDPGGASERGVALRGLGLFVPEPTAVRTSALRSAVASAHGPDFLDESSAALDRALDEADFGVDPDAERAHRLRERLELLAAFQVLAEGRRVDPARQVAPGGDAPLLPATRRDLARHARALEQDVVRLAASPRPDRGHALLLAIARHQTLQRSVDEGRLFTLDPFPNDAIAIDPPRREERRLVFERMAARLARERVALEARLLPRAELREPGLQALEVLQASLAELRHGIERGRPIRILDEISPPARSARVAPPRPRVLVEAGPQQALPLLAAASEVLADQRQRLDATYRYHLLERNCATELLRVAQEAFPSPEAARTALGGYLPPNDGLHFIPNQWIDAIEAGYANTHRYEIPSYRGRALARMQSRGDALRVALREGNTLTSQLYVGSPDDSHFLFFTEGAPWLRPLLGIANLGWGVGQSALGLFSWPWDGGERATRGLRGVLFSLPELGFVGIRKGTFEYVEPAGAR